MAVSVQSMTARREPARPCDRGEVHEFKVTPGGLIEHHKVARTIETQAVEVRHSIMLRLVHIGDQRTSRSNSQWLSLTPEAIQCVHSKLLDQGAIRSLWMEMVRSPGLHRSWGTQVRQPGEDREESPGALG